MDIEYFPDPPVNTEFKDGPDYVNNEGIVFNPEAPTQPTYDQADMETKAVKYRTSFDFKVDDVVAMLSSGREDDLLNAGAMIRDAKLKQEQQDIVKFHIDYKDPEYATQVANTVIKTDPRTALEQEWGDKAASIFPAIMDGRLGREVSPEAFDQLLDHTAEFVTRKEIAHTIASEWAPIIRDRSVFNNFNTSNLFSLDTLYTFLPLVTPARFAMAAQSGVLQSTNMEALLDEINTLPYAEGLAKAREVMSYLASFNINDAAVFMEALEGYSLRRRSGLLGENLLDASSIPGARVAARAIKGAAAGIGRITISPSVISSSAGNLNTAARTMTKDVLIQSMKATGNEASVDALMKLVPSFFDPHAPLRVHANLARTKARRLMNSLDLRADEMSVLAEEALSVKRLESDSPALARGYAEAETKIARILGNYRGAIMDVRRVDSDTNMANVALVEANIGKAKNVNEIKAATKDYEGFVDLLEKASEKGYTLYPSNLTKHKFYNQALKDGLLEEIKPRNRDPYVVINRDKVIEAKGDRTELVMGNLDADFFDSAATAKHHANLYGFAENGYTVVEEAPGKFYIRVIQHVDETTPGVYKEMEIQMRGIEPNNWASLMLRKMGSAESLNLTETMNAARKTTVHGTNRLLDALATHLSKGIKKPLRFYEKKQFSKFIEAQRDFEDTSGNVIGKFSKNQAEFENEWRLQFGSLPSSRQSTAYWGYVQMSDYDWVLRNINAYTQMASAGWQNIGFRGLFDSVAAIEGKNIGSLAETGLNYTPDIMLYEKKQWTSITRKQAEDLANKGYQMIQLHSQGQAKMKANVKGFGDTEVVLTRDAKFAPLSWDRVAHRPGGHRLHIDEYYGSVPLISRNKAGEFVYQRDFNVASHMIGSQMGTFAEHFNKARLMYKAKDPGLDKYVKDWLAMDPARFRQLYDDKILHVDDAMYVRRNGTTVYDSHPLHTMDQYKNKLIRSVNSLPEARENVAYLSERHPALPSISYGAPHQPIVRVGSSRLLDPMTTLAKTLNSSVRSLLTDDLKIKHAQDFIARFGHMLDIQDALQPRLDPIGVAMHAPFKKTVNDMTNLSVAKSYRKSIQNFMTMESTAESLYRTGRERMLESVYSKFGIKGAEVADTWAMSQITDPTKYLRAAAFHGKIGIFNPASFFVQLSQYVQSAAIAGPTRALDTLAWAQYALMMKHAHPKVRPYIAKLAGQWGGNTPQDFLDYYNALERSGLLNVRGTGSHADINWDSPLKASNDAAKKLRDTSRFFFDAGESLSRKLAFQIAFREQRALTKKAGKIGKVTDDEIRAMLQRSDVLLGNMTSASLANFQKGQIAAAATQFYNWPIRMSEQIFGNTLTENEKMRVVAANLILYGSAAAGLTGPLLTMMPWRDVWNIMMNEKGMDPEDTWYTDFLANGGLSMLTKALFGRTYNYNERFGPGQQNPIYQYLFKDEKSFIEVMMGASGSVITDSLKFTMPLLHQINAHIQGADTNPVDVIAELRDFVNRYSTTWNHAEALIAATTVGRYYSKNHKNISDLDATDAFVRLLTGLKPRAEQAGGEKSDYLKFIKAWQGSMDSAMLREHRAMYDAYQNEDEVAVKKHINRLQAYYVAGGFTEEEIYKFNRRALANYSQSYLSFIEQKLTERNHKQWNRAIIKGRRENGN